MAHNFTLPYGVLPKDVIDLGTVIGPFFLGHCFNWALYGVLVLQVYVYFLGFGDKDKLYVKLFVAGVFLLDSISIGLITHAGWRVLVSHWGDVNIITDLDWTWASLPVSTGIVSAIVQHFYAYRIRKLTEKEWPWILISLVSLGQLAFAIKTGEIAYRSKSFHYIRQLIPSLWLGGSILADILVSATLIITLRSKNGRLGFDTTHRVIQRMMLVSIETALPTTIVAFVKIILIFTNNDNRHLIFCIVLARLYSNCMLGALNSRHELFGGGNRQLSSSATGSQLSWFKNITNRLSSTGSRDSCEKEQITVSTHTKQEYDVELGLELDNRSSITGDLKGRLPNGDLPSPTFPSQFSEGTYPGTLPYRTPSEVVAPGQGYYETYSAITPQPGSTFQPPVHGSRSAFQ